MKNKIGFLLVSLMFAFASGGVLAASSSGYFIKNDKVTPEAALCTVHAYNIGQTKNFGGQYKEDMDQVVALKANLITREMKKQYDYLDATVKRFQIQLQKAILIAQAEAAGAPSASGSSGGSGSGSASLAGADNCSGKSRTDTVYCLRNNYQKLMSAVNANQVNTTSFRNQVQSDILAIKSMPLEKTQKDSVEKDMDTHCATRLLSTQKNAQTCLSYMNGAILAIEEYQAKSAAAKAPGT